MQQSDLALRKKGSLMSDNVEYYAVSTGIVLTAIAALVPFFA